MKIRKKEDNKKIEKIKIDLVKEDLAGTAELHNENKNDWDEKYFFTCLYIH